MMSMLFLFTLGFPLVLLALALVMGRVEQPLRDDLVGEQVAEVLERARPEDVESLVSQGLAPSLNRYWRRRSRRGRVLPRRSVGRA